MINGVAAVQKVAHELVKRSMAMAAVARQADRQVLRITLVERISSEIIMVVNSVSSLRISRSSHRAASSQLANQSQPDVVR